MQTPIYIINMPNCEERWNTTNERLESIGLQAERFSATVGKELSQADLEYWYCPKKNKQFNNRDLSPGEIGCYVSHMRIWQKMVDESISICVVLEDDLFIKPNLVNAISIAENYKNWDLIKLSDPMNTTFNNSTMLEHQMELGSYLKSPNGTQGYIIQLSGAKKLLTRRPFYRAVDVDMQFHSEVDLQMFGLKPLPILADDEFESEIVLANAGNHSNKSTFIRNLRYRTRLYFQRKKISGHLEKVIKS